jgi:hypothetical protein
MSPRKRAPKQAGISSRFTDDELAVFLHGCRTDTEYWQAHPDYPGMTVSNLGHVQHNGCLLSPYPSGKGYPTVTVKSRHRRVHQLVLETFIGPRPPGLECCHWDGVKINNRLMNLRWDTHAANAADSRRLRHEATLRAWDLRQRRALLAIAEAAA